MNKRDVKQASVKPVLKSVHQYRICPQLLDATDLTQECDPLNKSFAFFTICSETPFA